MKNYVAAVIFIVISFLTGLSIAFNICALLGNEKEFFVTKKRALTIYLVGGLCATLFTVISYVIVCFIQNMV